MVEEVVVEVSSSEEVSDSTGFCTVSVSVTVAVMIVGVGIVW